MKNHKTFRLGILPALLVPALMAVIPAQAEAAILEVTTTADPGDGGCTASGDGDGCTLREAITAANDQTLTPGSDTINTASGLSGTITLDTELPTLSTGITLNGPGAANLTVRRNPAQNTPEFRIFSINTATVGLSGLTISGGRVSGNNALGWGGGIYNKNGTLTLRNIVLQSNSATHGGAICNDGSNGGSAPLAISNSTFTGNGATHGGAIFNDGRVGGSATITELSHSTFHANTASGNGGAIANNGTAGGGARGSATMVITYSTLSANSATNGGGIDNNGMGGSATQAISHSTFHANTASGNGGAINNDGRSDGTNIGSATLTAGNSTFHANTAAAKGGAIRNDGTGANGSATVEIDNGTLKGNAAAGTSGAIDTDGTNGSATLALGSTILDNGPTKNIFMLMRDADTTFTSKNHNLSSDAAASNVGTPYLDAAGDIRNTDPKLDTLKSNGGPTQTLALLFGSPAIDQGLSSFPTDQRGPGFNRRFDYPGITAMNGADNTDIGAYEVQTVLTETPVNTPPVNTVPGAQNTRFYTPLVFSSGNSNALSIADSEAGTLQVTLSANNGTFTPGNTNGVTVSGNGTSTLTLSGTLTNLNSALNGLIYTPILTGGGFSVHGADTLTMTTNDGGHNGAPALQDNDTVAIMVGDSPTLTITDAAPVLEGNPSQGAPGSSNFAQFTVTLSSAIGSDIRVFYQTQTGTAVEGSDFVSTPDANDVNAAGQLVFAAGETQQTIDVPIIGDADFEQDESIVLSIYMPFPQNVPVVREHAAGPILNDEPAPAPAPSLSINDVVVSEGDNGSSNMAQFTVTLSSVSEQPVSVEYATAQGSAVAPDDFIASSGNFVFQPGQTTKQITVPVVGDGVFEGDEQFPVLIFNPTGASVARGQALGTITDNDAAVHSVSGRITFSSGEAASGVAVALQDGSGHQFFTVTDGNGQYGFDAVPPGNFLVRPVSETLVFSPPTRFSTMGNSDLTGLDFIASSG